MTVAALAAAGGLWFAFGNRGALPVLLKDGTQVKFHSVTRGTNHVARLGNLPQTLLSHAPQKLVPQALMKGIIVEKKTTSTNATIVWVHLSKAKGDLHFSVADETGVGAFRSQFVTVPRWNDGLYPLTLQQWPRSAPNIRLVFYGENARETLGSLLIENPSRSSITPFEARPVPPQDRNGELDLTLLSLEAKKEGKTFSTRAGPSWAGRACFSIKENGATNQHWEVHSLSLSDVGGNHRHATGPRAWAGEQFEIFFDPLFLTEGAWKLDVDLTRRSHFKPEETVTFTNVPVPSADGPDDALFRTNLLGRELVLHVMKKVQLPQTRASGVHSLGSPGFAVELADRNNLVRGNDDPIPGNGDLVPRVSMIQDDQGNPINVPAHGYGRGYSLMRFTAPKDRESPNNLIVQLALQPRRKFTFLADPKPID